jgi:anaerobic selenocysteine-containing dehydrogenase
MTDSFLAPQTVRGACPHDCPDTCALLTTVENGRATKVQGNPAHAQTDGVLCTKVSRYTERTYHPDRLLQPLRRVGPKGSGQFAPVSWDEALDAIAARLKTIAARDPQAILPYSYAGTMGLVQSESIAARFFHQLGASLLDRTICASAGAEALTQTLGNKVGMKVEFFAESKLIVIWGSNSIGSNLHFWRIAQEAKRNGAKLVCIDPRRSETAEKCHEHIALRPGTDAALALAVMHELIVHGWLDQDYIDRYTLGWDALKARALQWTPERAAEVCGVPVAQIRQLARDWGTTQPAAIRLNYGMQRVRGGGNAVRAIACLPALTGAWRHRAGGVLLSSSGHFPVRRAALQRPDLLGARRPRTINMATIGDDLLRPASPAFGPKIEALVVYNSNPVAVAPESGKASPAKTWSPWCWSTSRPTPPITQTSSCPPPRSWSTGTSTPATATPMCCSTARRSRLWAVRAPTPTSSGRWLHAWGLTIRVLPRATKACAAVPLATRKTLSSCWSMVLLLCLCPMRRSRMGAFLHLQVAASFSASAWPTKGWTACLTTCPITKRLAAMPATRWP